MSVDREQLATEASPATAAVLSAAEGEGRLPVNAAMLASGLSAAAAAWMVSGLFRGLEAKLICLAAVIVGTGVVWLSFRLRRPQALHYALAPIALVAAAIAAVPAAQGATLPDSVVAAISNGGLLEPPIAFDAGWRFIAVLLLASVAGATALLTLSTSRPRLSLMLPLPVVAGAALLQPQDGQLLSGIVALVCVIGALMVLSGAEIGSEADVSRGFAVRRNARGAGALAALVVALVALNQSNALFPEPVHSRVAEPERPKAVALKTIKDRPLFTVQGDNKGPWRVGVLDVYQDNALLLPPYQPGSFRTLDASAKVANENTTTRDYTFVVQQAGGHSLPTPGDPVAIHFSGPRLAYDPRSQTFHVVDVVAPQGFKYTVTAAASPGGEQLASATAAPPSFRDYLSAPAPPTAVQELLSKAPTNRWERLQYMRARLYEKVVAGGAGQPVDVPASRVEQMLAGGEGTPFEITAAEVLLARWSGVPARLAFGYYGGQQVAGGYEIHPRDGANWLEVYFEGYGWVPIFGVPPQARATLNQADKNRNVQVRASDDIEAEIYVPFSLDNPLAAYEVVRYWVAVAAPFVLAIVVALFLYPWPLKLLRRRARRRWARGLGLPQQVAVEYAEFRDAATDLNAGNMNDTPLEFLDRIEEDAEHEELAWLTTRALWGDLARDLHPDDVVNARELATSVRRRLARAQTPVNRILALGSRASLREPYDASLPNLWRTAAGKDAGRGSRPGLARAFATAMLIIGALAGCGEPANAMQPHPLPRDVVPANLAGFTTREEPAAEKVFRDRDPHSEVDKGLVYSLVRDNVVRGLVQVGVFRPDVQDTKIHVRHEVRSGVGNGHFKFYKVHGVWVGEQDRADVRVFMWFPAREHTYEMLTLRTDENDYANVLITLIAWGRGGK